jgi:TonB-dependent receptor
VFRLCAPLLAVLLLAASAGATGAPPVAGRIAGTISDAVSGETLIGANVRLAGTTIGDVTDRDGRYVIPSVPDGPQVVVVSYVGYTSDTTTVVVRNGETEVHDVALQSATFGEVVVTAQVAGQLAAVNEQFGTATVTNIVSADRIRELPDNNAAESLGRLPGVAIQRSGGEANRVAIRGLSPQYNTVTVNGVRLPTTDSDSRAVDLSLVSSNILDGIEVRKSITPDMDADAIGGSVDLRLRNAPEGFQGDFLVQGGYTALQNDAGNYRLVGSLSNRFLGNRLGVIGTVNADRADRSADRGGISFNTSSFDPNTGERVIRVTGFNLREETVDRSRTGGSLLLDYALPGGRVTGNVFYNALDNEGLSRVYNPTEGSRNISISRYDDRTSITTSALGADQDFGWLRYDATLSYTTSRRRSPSNYVWEFGQDGNAFGDTGPERDGVVPDSVFATAFARDDSTTALTSIWVDSARLTEDQTTAKINLQAPFRLGTWLSGFFKTGGQLRWLDRSYDIERSGRQGLRYAGGATPVFQCLGEALGPDWAARLGDDGSAFFINEILLDYDRAGSFLDGRFGLGAIADDAQLLELTRGLQSDACADDYLRNSITSIGQDYNGTEQYQSGYGMTRLNVGRYLTVIAGLRYERDASSYNGQRFREVVQAFQDGPPVDLEALTVERDNAYLLPGLHFDIRPMEWLSVRLARTETLTRPSFNQYAPITSIDGNRSFIRAAASGLRPSEATNYDASVQIVRQRIGLLGASVFHKRITDLVVYAQFPTQLFLDANRDTVVVGVPEGSNVPTAWLIGASPTLGTFINNDAPTTFYGYELEWQTNFSYLPGLLRGIVLSVNYTRAFSEASYRSTQLLRTFVPGSRPPRFVYSLADTTRTGRMPDQPEHVFNATLGWDIGGFSARLSYLFQSNTTRSVDLREPLGDQFVGDYSRFDLSLRQVLRGGLELVANFNNLNNQSDRVYSSQRSTASEYVFTDDFLSNIELYGPTVDLGVRYRF